MEHYAELKDMLHAELERIQQKGELSAASLAQADTIAHTLKDLATVEAMENSGYSEKYAERYRYDDGSRRDRRYSMDADHEPRRRY